MRCRVFTILPLSALILCEPDTPARAVDASPHVETKSNFPHYDSLRQRAEKLWGDDRPKKGSVLVLVPPESPLRSAAGRLAEYRKAEIVSHSPSDPEASIETLIKRNARYITIFVEPHDMDANLLRRFIVLSTLMDSDPFCDFAFGFVTASSCERVLAFVERIIRADAEGVKPYTASVCLSNVSHKFEESSFVQGMPGEANYVKLGDMTYARKALSELGRAGFIHIGGCGDPEGVWMFSDERNRDRSKHWAYDPTKVAEGSEGDMPRLVAGDFRKLKLDNPVVWTHVCHIGSPYRVYVTGDIVSTFGRSEKVEAYTIPSGRSVALAMIEAGASAFIAPLGPNHGAQSTIEQAAASELGIPLGDVLRRAYHDVVMDTQGHPDRIGLYVEGKPAGWSPDGFTNYNFPHHRALYGDPQFRPFGAFRSPATVKIDAQKLDNNIILKFKIAASGYLGRTVCGNRGGLDKGQGRIYEVIELDQEPEELAVGEVKATDPAGETFNIISKTALIEKIDGKAFLHLQLISDSATALCTRGTIVEAVIHFDPQHDQSMRLRCRRGLRPRDTVTQRFSDQTTS